jgi:hypothetical protein
MPKDADPCPIGLFVGSFPHTQSLFMLQGQYPRRSPRYCDWPAAVPGRDRFRLVSEAQLQF